MDNEIETEEMIYTKLRMYMERPEIKKDVISYINSGRSMTLNREALAESLPTLVELMQEYPELFARAFKRIESHYKTLYEVGNSFSISLDGVPMQNNGHINPEQFFLKDSFIPKLLADHIKALNTFRTTKADEVIYIYNRGVYRPLGEQVIKSMVTDILGNMSRRRHSLEVVHAILSSTYTEDRDFPVNLINLKNGIYNIDRDILMSHSPDYFTITQLPVNYDGEADCPKIKQFITEVVGEEQVPLIQELIGYCLYRQNVFDKAFIFLGEGSNGKSTLINLIKMFLGDENTVSISLQNLEKNNFSKASLYGKLADVYPDLSDNALRETGMFKLLTSRDQISADQKYKKELTFTNYAKLIFSANRLPKAYDDSDAFYRRWVIVQFDRQFILNKDMNILEKITDSIELSGMFNWAIEGLKRILENGKFSDNKEINDMRTLYRRLSSPIAAFVDACLEEDSSSEISKEELYAQFVAYCKKEHLIAVKDNSFYRSFASECDFPVKQTRTKINNKQVYCIKGVKFIEPDSSKKVSKIADFKGL